jgi:hypothetical protein
METDVTSPLALTTTFTVAVTLLVMPLFDGAVCGGIGLPASRGGCPINKHPPYPRGPHAHVSAASNKRPKKNFIAL